MAVWKMAVLPSRPQLSRFRVCASYCLTSHLSSSLGELEEQSFCFPKNSAIIIFSLRRCLSSFDLRLTIEAILRRTNYRTHPVSAPFSPTHSYWSCNVTSQPCQVAQTYGTCGQWLPMATARGRSCEDRSHSVYLVLLMISMCMFLWMCACGCTCTWKSDLVSGIFFSVALHPSFLKQSLSFTVELMHSTRLAGPRAPRTVSSPALIGVHCRIRLFRGCWASELACQFTLHTRHLFS